MLTDLSWDRVCPDVRARFIARMAEMLPQLDPRTEWENISVCGRREMAWHLLHPLCVRRTWEEDDERIRTLADEATAQAFRVLADLEVR